MAILLAGQISADVDTLDAQGVIISDAFTNKSPFRDIGDPLNGTYTEAGSRRWEANPQVVFGINHIKVANPAPDVSYNGGFPFTIPANMPIASVEADVDVRGSEWIAVGFSLSAKGGYWAHGQVFMLLHPNGQAEVFANGTRNPGSRLGGKLAPVFYYAGYNRLKVEYDSAAKTVSAWVNGAAILNRHYLNIPGFTPNIQYAGFHIWNDNNAATSPLMKIDNFKASAQPVPVDNQPPRVAIEKPAQNETVSGKTLVRGWAIDGGGVVNVNFKLDGQPINLEDYYYGEARADVCRDNPDINDLNCPYVGWRGMLNTNAFADGRHTLEVTARDASGNSTTIKRDFEINNAIKTLTAFDGFTNKSPNRDVGDPLHGTLTELGGKTWDANLWVVFGNNVITNTGTLASHIGGIPFNPNADPGKPVASVEALANVKGSEWIGLGFAGAAQGGYWGTGQVWMLLKKDGRMEIWANGTRHYLGGPQAPQFNAAGFNTLNVEYDARENTFSAWVNHINVLYRYDLDRLGFKPRITHAGFHIYTGSLRTQGQVAIDDFLIRVYGPGQNSAGLPKQKAESESDADDQLAAIPDEYSLAQNYPNPFNPSTTIRYGLPKEGHVTLKIYNLTGQEVRTLVDDFQSAGLRTITWDGKDNLGQQVPSGVYLYRIVARDYNQTRRMILMK
jgi:hypothetical protein